MNSEQMQALGRVLEHFGDDFVRNYEETGKPPGHLAEAFLALDNYRQARSLEMDDERKGRAPRDDDADDPTTASALGIIQDHSSRDEERGPSVVGRGSKEIETRWAKETIGLAAIELNEAYAQFDTTSDGLKIPSGKLHCAARRLEEAMQRLGLTDDIPF